MRVSRKAEAEISQSKLRRREWHETTEWRAIGMLSRGAWEASQIYYKPY